MRLISSFFNFFEAGPFLFDGSSIAVEGISFILTLVSGVLVFGVLRWRTHRKLAPYLVTLGVMLLFAVLETWIVTIWQPDLGRRDLEDAVAKFFAFPYTVTIREGEFLWIYSYIGVLIECGNLRLFLFLSPTVIHGSAEMVFWFAQIRLLAFRIVISFHLIALLLFMLILTSVDIIYRRFHIRAVTKHSKAAHEGFSCSSEEERADGSVTQTASRNLAS